MWTEWHDSVRDHPKILKLARDLGVDEAKAVGLMGCLWAWTLRMAVDGNYSSFEVEDIELGAKWDGEPGAFAAAALKRRLLDETPDGLVCHDWLDYAGSLKATLRMRELRDRKKRNAETNAISTVPNSSEREPTTPEEDLEASEGFFTAGWRNGDFDWLKAFGCWAEFMGSMDEPFHHKKASESILRSSERAAKLRTFGSTPREVCERAVKNCAADAWVREHRPGPEHLAKNFTKYLKGPVRSEEDEEFKDLRRRLREAEENLEFDQRMGGKPKELKARKKEVAGLKEACRRYLDG